MWLAALQPQSGSRGQQHWSEARFPLFTQLRGPADGLWSPTSRAGLQPMDGCRSHPELAPSEWTVAAYIQRWFSPFRETSLETPSQTHLEVCFHGDSKYSQMTVNLPHSPPKQSLIS